MVWEALYLYHTDAFQVRSTEVVLSTHLFVKAVGEILIKTVLKNETNNSIIFWDISKSNELCLII
jgi:hypothetical protein